MLNTHYPEVAADRSDGEGVKTLIREICELFPEAPYLHIGGDEANIALWNQCADCRAYIEKNGIDDVYGLYSDYVARIAAYVLSLGKTPIVWEGFPESGSEKIPKETVVISREMTFEQEINSVVAHLAALSERTWTTRRVRTFGDFRQALNRLYYLSARIIQDV